MFVIIGYISSEWVGERFISKNTFLLNRKAKQHGRTGIYTSIPQRNRAIQKHSIWRNHNILNGSNDGNMLHLEKDKGFRDFSRTNARKLAVRKEH